MLQLVTDNTSYRTRAEQMAAQVRALADMIENGLDFTHGMIVGVVNGSVSYAPLGTITLIEATGLMELANRKIERDLS